METISRMSEIAATLGNEYRLILVQLIAEGEKSVESLSDLSGLPVASTSQHLQVLKKGEMVVTRREGKRIFYRLQNGPIRELIDALHRFAVFHDLKAGKGNSNDADGIEPKALEKKLKTGKVTLIDVRSHEEFQKGHITGAISLPFTELKQHAARLKKSGEIVVYCRGPHCVLSHHAVDLLRAKGIEAVRLTSGYSDWRGND
jgi:rhodanese-related sulfurtransferase